ncbi:MAG TPA: hypothetical protein VEZ90_00100 [Blastocatellia bacterium]|nr:hypothetical protein [Blastocatellia bacterium]
MLTKTLSRSITIGFAVLFGIAAVALATTKNSSNHKAVPKVVELRLTFSDGGWAEVHQLEGQMIRVTENGKTLGITPFIRNVSQKQVDLQVFSIDETAGVTKATPVSSCTLTNAPATLKDVISPVSVQFEEFETTQQPGGRECCAPDCNGRIICAFCVCTKCGVCGPCLCIPFPG